MPIFHIAYHGYKHEPSDEELRERLAMFQAAFAALPYIEMGVAGRYLGPEEGFHDAVCVKFKDLGAYRAHMQAPHGPDEATHLWQHVARIRAFDIITPDEPADTRAKIIELYKERWKLFPDVARVLRKEIDSRLPYL